jgi:hypothetical protein
MTERKHGEFKRVAAYMKTNPSIPGSLRGAQPLLRNPFSLSLDGRGQGEGEKTKENNNDS